MSKKSFWFSGSIVQTTGKYKCQKFNLISTRICKFVNANLVKMKKVLFISYASENLNKVTLITKEFEDHPLFEPLVVSNKREPNKALIKKVTSGIKSSYCLIALLTRESIKEQWINQEIGYAFGKKKPVIPIVEQILLDRDSLKGFIHKQNDCPYTYPTRKGLLMREENKGFMGVFRLLIKDLENDLKSDTNSSSSKRNVTITGHVISATEVPLGFKRQSGDVCPRTGNWKVEGEELIQKFRIGDEFPTSSGKSIGWILFSYATGGDARFT